MIEKHVFSNVLTVVDVLVFCIEDRPPNPVEEAVESVNPRDQGLLASDPSKYVRS